jgi:hypothetical protein
MPFNLAERFIGTAEEKLGAPLPHSYRQAMMASNGGDVAVYNDIWNLHPILDSSDRKRLSRSCNDILQETRLMRDWPGWPENAVAIAGNGSGDKLLFLREGPAVSASTLRVASRHGRLYGSLGRPPCWSAKKPAW